MNITENTIKFYQYDSKQTGILRHKWCQSSDQQISKNYMVDIDQDFENILEEKCPYKKVRIGTKYQITTFPPLSPNCLKKSSTF